jgi:hypothetical protein
LRASGVDNGNVDLLIPLIDCLDEAFDICLLAYVGIECGGFPSLTLDPLT